MSRRSKRAEIAEEIAETRTASSSFGRHADHRLKTLEACATSGSTCRSQARSLCHLKSFQCCAVMATGKTDSSFASSRACICIRRRCCTFCPSPNGLQSSDSEQQRCPIRFVDRFPETLQLRKLQFRRHGDRESHASEGRVIFPSVLRRILLLICQSESSAHVCHVCG